MAHLGAQSTGLGGPTQVVAGPGFGAGGFEFDSSVTLVNFGNDFKPVWPILTGRELFNHFMISGLNRTPVTHHMSYILGGRTVEENEELPFSIDKTTEVLIVDGTVVIERFQDEDGNETSPTVFLTNIVFATDRKVIRKIPDQNFEGQTVFVIYTLLPNGFWEVVHVVNLGAETQAVIPGSHGEKNPDSFFVFPNSNGLLYDAQYTLNRLEEIKQRIRKVTNNTVTLIFSGFGGNLQQAKNAVNDEGSDKLFMPSGVTAQTVATNNVVEQLMLDWVSLLKQYMLEMNMTDFELSAQESGIARRMRIQPMLFYVRRQRQNLKAIYKMQPFTGEGGIEIEFDSMLTSSPEERQAELNLLIAERDAGILDQDEFIAKGKKRVV